MSIQKRAIVLRNHFGFTLAAKAFNDGCFGVRLFNFHKQPTDATTLPEAEAVKLRDFLNSVYPPIRPTVDEKLECALGDLAQQERMCREAQSQLLQALAFISDVKDDLRTGSPKLIIDKIERFLAHRGPQRECCNDECGWKGITDRVLSGHGKVPDVGPLCPRCGETTEIAE